MLIYFAQQRDSVPIFQALTHQSDFREDLTKRCKDTLRPLGTEFPYFSVQGGEDVDELGDALLGLRGIKEASADDYPFQVVNADKWNDVLPQGDF